MTRTRRILISSVLVVLIFVLFYNFSISPKRVRIRELNLQHQKVVEVLASSHAYIDKYRDVKTAYDSIYAVWEKLGEYLPEEEEMPELLTSISDASKKSGVEFILFKPMTLVPRDFYQENPIQIKVTCGYHELGWFLSRVAELPRLVNVAAFKLTQAKEPSSDATVNAEFVATVYTTKR